MFKIRKSLKIGLLIFLVISVSLAIEILFFNRHALGDQANHLIISGADLFKQSEGFHLNDQAIVSDQAQARIRIELPTGYFEKVRIGYTASVSDQFTLLCYTKDQHGISGVITFIDEYDHRMPRAVVNTQMVFSELEVVVPIENIEVHRLELLNQVRINPFRLLFLLSCGLIIVLLLMFSEKQMENLATPFLVLALIVGFQLLACLPLAHVSWDEDTHLPGIYRQSFFQYAAWRQAAIEYESHRLSVINSAEEHLDLMRYYASDDANKVVWTEVKGRFIPLNHRGYLPQSTMMRLARYLGLSFTWMHLAGRLGGLLFYAFIVMLAIHIAKAGKRLIAVIGLLPTPLYLASTFNYDYFIIAVSLLAMAAFIRLYLSPNDRITARDAILFIGPIILACYIKPVYAPLILLVMLLPQSKYVSRKQMILFKTGSFMILVLLLSSMALLAFMNPQTVSDPRGGDTSVSGQIAYILSNPLTFFSLLSSRIATTFLPYLLGTETLMHFAYLGIMQHNTHYIAVGLLLFTSHIHVSGNPPVLALPGRHKLFLLGLILMSCALIWTALYLSFTPVGLYTINGVQPRYYLPLLMPAALLLRSNRISISINVARLNRIILGISAFIVMNSIYQRVILPICQ
ncbi:MAG: DUF2142 domain-containing protein [Clostridiales bacterium]|nr:DUF2142 domain-containing protein [Clostridiales bacterium]